MKSREELPALFEKHRVTGLGAEIGVYKGVYSRTILNQYKGQLLLVDGWKYGGLPCVLHMLEETEYNINIRIGDSVAVSKTIPDEALDFVYIDADHTYQGCLLDIVAWESKVRKNGIIAGHDFACYPDERIDVKRAVEKYYPGQFQLTTDDLNPDNGRYYNSWWLIKE